MRSFSSKEKAIALIEKSRLNKSISIEGEIWEAISIEICLKIILTTSLASSRIINLPSNLSAIFLPTLIASFGTKISISIYEFNLPKIKSLIYPPTKQDPEGKEDKIKSQL